MGRDVMPTEEASPAVPAQPTVGFLHTSPVHVPAFEALTAAALPSARVLHVVDEQLLAEAQRIGVEGDGAGAAAVAADVRSRVAELVEQGADAICCTCSTIGALAEQVQVPGVPVLRVDRPMARRAAAIGPRVGVLAALESTLEPTRLLLEDEAARAGAAVTIELAVADGAWAWFTAGDHEVYRQVLEDAARALATRADVVVLAQASMAAVEPRLADLGVPVLSSPRLATWHLAELLAVPSSARPDSP
ncbi:hypothetical protein GCM10025862_24240 [Arsenicicoccus piscis]|uniref:Arylsulfatase n=1 Tax=Arsenicicoccus piscis TaxID=673954 RepID=A0ABQ6HQQ1_9MICO|nr:hypothetical protein GCM10025862_24240 [Arsenicicoccus piscis]